MTATLAWQKSSFSGSGDGNNCVEVAALNGDIRLRESEAAEVIIAAAPTALAAMLYRAKSAGLSVRP